MLSDASQIDPLRSVGKAETNMTVNEPQRQFRLTGDEVVAIQRDGTLRRDLDIVEWMERSVPHGEYRASADAFVVSTATENLRAGTDDWIVRLADGRFLPCSGALLTAITCGPAELARPSLCEECGDAVPPADLNHVNSGARLCLDCLLEYQLLLETPEQSAELDSKRATRSAPRRAQA